MDNLLQCLELLILENGQTRSGRSASDVSITGLAATIVARNEIIASTSNDFVVRKWE